MSVNHFIQYKGRRYDVGTRLRIRAYEYGYYQGVKEGVIENFIGTTAFIQTTDGKCYECSTLTTWWPEENIVEIIEPVYYIEYMTTNARKQRPQSWDLEMGWTWYIIIMVVGSLFKDRWMIYFCVTAYFLLWKNGFLQGGNK